MQPFCCVVPLLGAILLHSALIWGRFAAFLLEHSPRVTFPFLNCFLPPSLHTQTRRGRVGESSSRVLQRKSLSLQFCIDLVSICCLLLRFARLPRSASALRSAVAESGRSLLHLGTDPAPPTTRLFWCGIERIHGQAQVWARLWRRRWRGGGYG